MESIIAALITGAVTLIGVLIANGKSQAVTETKLDELTRSGSTITSPGECPWWRSRSRPSATGLRTWKKSTSIKGGYIL